MPKDKDPKVPINKFNLPRRNDKLWTYSENKILDQITLEVMEAWREDLNIIRKAHTQCKQLLIDSKNLADVIQDQREEISYQLEKQRDDIELRFEGINSFLKSIDFNFRLERIRLEVEEIGEKVDNLNKTSRSIKIQKKPSFFRRLFKCKAH